MRIAFISYEFPPDTGKGGIGTYTSQVAGMLVNKGWDVHVFAGSHTRQLLQCENGIHVHWIQCADSHDFSLNVLPFFKKEHTRLAFEVVESPEINGNAWEVKKKFPQIPLVIRLHAPNTLVEQLKKKYIPFKAKLRFVLGALKHGKWDAGYWRRYDHVSDRDYQFTLLADAISAPSEIMKKWVVKKWELPASKIILLPNPFIAPEALLQLPVSTKSFYKQVVFFGRLNVLKGLVNATLVMKKILKEFPAYSFKVIGDDGPGPYYGINMRNWMKMQLQSVKERVIFLDGLPFEKLPGAIADAEIVLLPSLFESFSYTCAEAMAAGKAVVASSDTGMADLIENNKTGMLADAENVDEIYTALKRLIKDDGMRYRIAKNARKSISEKFNAEKLADKYTDFYECVAAN
jgi:glycogen synthase